MIDFGVLTWTQQWEYWLFSRLLRPVEFANVFRWDFLLVPDQVWLLVGAFRAVRTLVGGEGSLWTKFLALGGAMRNDPLLFLAFGLVFVAEPQIMARFRARQAGVEELLDAGDLDAVIAMEEDQRVASMNPEYAAAIEASQSGNETVLPASVLNSCRTCKSDKVAATNLIVNCGHFPFCDACIAKPNFACTLCTAKGLKTDQKLQTFGMTSTDLAKPPTIVNISPSVQISKSCGVCQEREGMLTLMPCGHLLFCGPCVLGFRMRCPFCRVRITRAIRSFDVRHNEGRN